MAKLNMIKAEKRLLPLKWGVGKGISTMGKKNSNLLPRTMTDSPKRKELMDAIF